LKTVSGGLYSGRITEISNDHICLNETLGEEGVQVYVFYDAIESLTVGGEKSK